MHLEHMNKGDIVFHYNDPPDKFYIIIEGSVAVWLP